MSGLWVPVSGAVGLEREVDAIANNVANVATPGFKRDQVTFREHLTALDRGAVAPALPEGEWSPEDFYRSHGAEAGQVKADGAFTDFTQGRLVPTGNPLDLALHGGGFFEVLAEGGVRATRRGTFSLSPEGFLTDHRGRPVLAPAGAAGEPPLERRIRIEGSGPVEVNAGGEVFRGGRGAGRLSVVHFKDPHSLRKEGSGYFIGTETDPAGGPTTVHQGFVEASNVSAVREMGELIRANRLFESMQRAIKAYDQVAGRANEIVGP